MCSAGCEVTDCFMVAIWKLRLQVNVRVDCTCADGDAYGLAGQIYGLIGGD